MTKPRLCLIRPLLHFQKRLMVLDQIWYETSAMIFWKEYDAVHMYHLY
jgi:hypothetical protein